MRHGYPSNAFLTTTIMATMGEKGVTQTMLSPLLAARTLNITGIHISSRAVYYINGIMVAIYSHCHCTIERVWDL
jgi:hypothetical protein